MVPSGSLDPLPSNVSVAPICAEVGPVMLAVGIWLTGCTPPTVTVNRAGVELSKPSFTINCTVILPALLNWWLICTPL